MNYLLIALIAGAGFLSLGSTANAQSASYDELPTLGSISKPQASFEGGSNSDVDVNSVDMPTKIHSVEDQKKMIAYLTAKAEKEAAEKED